MESSARVSAELSGGRVDKVVLALFPGLSRARVKKAIEARAVRVNGRVRPKGEVVAEGDTISVDSAFLVSPDEALIAEPNAGLEVRYQDDHVLVVDKPAGQPTIPIRAAEKGTLANALIGQFPELAGVGRTAREPGVIHRLDNDTSGLVIVARTEVAFEVLTKALREEQIEKSYLLLCNGEDLPDFGTIDIPLTNHPKDKKRVYPCIHPRDVMRYQPRPASTSYEVVTRMGPWALVRAHAKKATRHQIRVHFSAIEHPLLGDELYGGPAVDDLSRHALHAERVQFGGEKPVRTFDVQSPLPVDLAALVARIG